MSITNTSSSACRWLPEVTQSPSHSRDSWVHLLRSAVCCDRLRIGLYPVVQETKKRSSEGFTFHCAFVVVSAKCWGLHGFFFLCIAKHIFLFPSCSLHSGTFAWCGTGHLVETRAWEPPFAGAQIPHLCLDPNALSKKHSHYLKRAHPKPLAGSCTVQRAHVGTLRKTVCCSKAWLGSSRCTGSGSWLLFFWVWSLLVWK